jgi:uncharacterized protein with von Willebrand factor type A (vWA) domain
MASPTPAAKPKTGNIEALRELNDLKDKHDRGVISDEDYDRERAVILGNM